MGEDIDGPDSLGGQSKDKDDISSASKVKSKSKSDRSNIEATSDEDEDWESWAHTWEFDAQNGWEK